MCNCWQIENNEEIGEFFELVVSQKKGDIFGRKTWMLGNLECVGDVGGMVGHF